MSKSTLNKNQPSTEDYLSTSTCTAVDLYTAVYTAVCVLRVLKINSSKFTRGLALLYGDACSAKSLEVLTLVFSTDCGPIDWVQSVLKITRFENVFFFLSLF